MSDSREIVAGLDYPSDVLWYAWASGPHRRLVLESADVAPYAFWDPDKLYTRNLVATDSKNYTILLLCWNPGKESPIHDHPCEGCWVKTVRSRPDPRFDPTSCPVYRIRHSYCCLCIGCEFQVQGCVKETVYEQSEKEGGALMAVRETTFHPDELSYIEGMDKTRMGRCLISRQGLWTLPRSYTRAPLYAASCVSLLSSLPCAYRFDGVPQGRQ